MGPMCLFRFETFFRVKDSFVGVGLRCMGRYLLRLSWVLYRVYCSGLSRSYDEETDIRGIPRSNYVVEETITRNVKVSHSLRRTTSGVSNKQYSVRGERTDPWVPQTYGCDSGVNVVSTYTGHFPKLSTGQREVYKKFI